MSAAGAQRVVLITGYAGFSGRHLVSHLRRNEAALRIVGFDVCPADIGGVDQHIAGDLLQFGAISAAVDACRPDAIIHLAGRTPPASDADLWAANVGATFNLLEAVRQAGLQPRILVIGSAAEYGPAQAPLISEEHPCRPTTAYGRSKLAQTLLCQHYGARFTLPIVIARTFNLFGPGMPPRTVIGELCAQIAASPSGGVLRVGDVSGARDFIDVRDAAALYWALACRGMPGQVYNVCTGRATVIRDLLHLLLAVAGASYRIESQAERFREGDVRHSCGDCTKLLQVAGIRPQLPLLDSLRDTLADFRRRPPPCAGQ